MFRLLSSSHPEGQDAIFQAVAIFEEWMANLISASIGGMFLG
jgi:hypothetical protein